MLLSAGCTATQPPVRHPSPTTNAGAAVAEAWPVTPSARDDVHASTRRQWAYPVFGYGNLWVWAWWDNPQSLKHVRSKDPGDSPYPYQEKYPTWTLKDGKATDTSGASRVSVNALNRQGCGTGAVGGYATATLDDGAAVNWWPTGVSFSAAGCWQVTESVGGDTITYVVKI